MTDPNLAHDADMDMHSAHAFDQADAREEMLAEMAEADAPTTEELMGDDEEFDDEEFDCSDDGDHHMMELHENAEFEQADEWFNHYDYGDSDLGGEY